MVLAKVVWVRFRSTEVMGLEQLTHRPRKVGLVGIARSKL